MYLDQKEMNPKSRQSSCHFDILQFGIDLRHAQEFSMLCENPLLYFI